MVIPSLNLSRKREGNLTTEVRADGTRRAISREWVPESPVALEFNGLSYAVMMATPADLEDFGLGFSLSEGIAAAPGDIRDVEVARSELGVEVRMWLAAERAERLAARRRSPRTG